MLQVIINNVEQEQETSSQKRSSRFGSLPLMSSRLRGKQRAEKTRVDWSPAIERINRQLAKILEFSKKLKGMQHWKMVLYNENILQDLCTLRKCLEEEIKLLEFEVHVKLSEWFGDMQAAQERDDEDAQQIMAVYNKLTDVDEKMEKRYRHIIAKVEELAGSEFGQKGHRNETSFPNGLPGRMEYMDSPEYRTAVLMLQGRDKPWPESMINALPLTLGDRIRPRSDGNPEIRHAHPTSGPSRDLIVKTYFNVSDDQKERLRQELQLCSKLRHPNIASFLGVNMTIPSQSPKCINLVLEWCNFGNLQDFLEAVRFQEKKKVDINTLCLKLIAELGAAIEYLHTPTADKPSIVHGDIRPSKVLISEGSVKLTSFRRSRKLEDITSRVLIAQSKATNNTMWRAPETMDPNRDDLEMNPYTLEADVYAWAVTSVFAFTEDVPYNGVREVNLTTAMQRQDPFKDPDTLEMLRKCGVHDLLARCWQREAKARPRISEVCFELKGIRERREVGDEVVPSSHGTTMAPSTPPTNDVPLA